MASSGPRRGRQKEAKEDPSGIVGRAIQDAREWIENSF